MSKLLAMIALCAVISLLLVGCAKTAEPPNPALGATADYVLDVAGVVQEEPHFIRLLDNGDYQATVRISVEWSNTDWARNGMLTILVAEDLRVASLNSGDRVFFQCVGETYESRYPNAGMEDDSVVFFAYSLLNHCRLDPEIGIASE